MKRALKIYSRIVLFLIPFFFLPVIYNSFTLGRNLFLLISAFVGLLMWVIDLFISKKNLLKWNKILTWFSILLVWFIISFLRMEAGVASRSLMAQSGFLFYVGVFIWLFLWIQVTDKEERKKQFKFLTASGIVVAVLSLIAFMIPSSKMPLVWPKNKGFLSINEGWSITGSLIGELFLFSILVFDWFSRLLKKIKEKQEIGDYLKEAVGVVFFGLLLFLDIYKLFKLGWNFLDRSTSWVIAVETLKTNPIFGVGLGNFSQAFQMFKPAAFNLTKLWSLNFSSSGMFLLNLWTEAGLVGLLLLVVAVLSLVKRVKKKNVALLLLMVLVLLMPVSFLGLFLFVWVLALSGIFENKELRMRLKMGDSDFDVMPFLWMILVSGVVIFGSYWVVRIGSGSFYWRKSLMATAENDGVAAYNWQIKAIAADPSEASYRMIYSQTNLALAQSILSKEDMTDEEKQRGTVLVQQAVREAKAAVNLDNKNSNYWFNLGSIYVSLMGLVDGSDEWALQAYQQAITFDGNNPLIKLELGGLFYGAENYESASRLFEEVVLNKNDYANGWYNWAHSTKQLGRIEQAVYRLETALTLVPAGSEDYNRANEELSVWKEELKDLNDKSNEIQDDGQEEEVVNVLTTPAPIPEIDDEEQLDVSEEEIKEIEMFNN